MSRHVLHGVVEAREVHRDCRLGWEDISLLRGLCLCPVDWPLVDEVL